MKADMKEAYLALLEKVILNEILPENGARMKFLLEQAVNGAPDRWSFPALIAELVALHRTHPRMMEELAGAPESSEASWWVSVLGFPFSMVGRGRLQNVRDCAQSVLDRNIPGAMIETGVWRGGSCLMMKGVMRAAGASRGLYVCDSFAGLPNMETGPDKELNLDENPILTSPVEDVRSHFERLDLLDDDVHFVKGWFCDTMADLARRLDDGISVLRLDGDYYSSTMDVLRPLYPLVNKGGYVIIDDYHAYEQCRQATDEYRAAQGITAPLIEIDGVGVYWQVA